jgi:hypothetical protein
MPVRLIGSVAFATCLAVFVGCNQQEPTLAAVAKDNGPPKRPRQEIPVAQLGTSSLKGKITSKARPIVAGRLLFVANNGIVPVAGKVLPDGSYEASALPEGELRICVLLDPKGAFPFPLPDESHGGPPGLAQNRPPDPHGSQGPPGPPVPPGVNRGAPPGRPMPPNQVGRNGPPGPPGAVDRTALAGGPPPGVNRPMPPDRSIRNGPPGPPGAPAPGGGPPGAASTGEDQFGVHLPVGFPPRVVRELKDFSIPAGSETWYAQLHAKYGRPGAANPLKATIKAGENVLNLELP